MCFACLRRAARILKMPVGFFLSLCDEAVLTRNSSYFNVWLWSLLFTVTRVGAACRGFGEVCNVTAENSRAVLVVPVDGHEACRRRKRRRWRWVG
jgi:hypothetical protein